MAQSSSSPYFHYPSPIIYLIQKRGKFWYEEDLIWGNYSNSSSCDIEPINVSNSHTEIYPNNYTQWHPTPCAIVKILVKYSILYNTFPHLGGEYNAKSNPNYMQMPKHWRATFSILFFLFVIIWVQNSTVFQFNGPSCGGSIKENHDIMKKK